MSGLAFHEARYRALLAERARRRALVDVVVAEGLVPAGVEAEALVSGGRPFEDPLPVDVWDAWFGAVVVRRQAEFSSRPAVGRQEGGPDMSGKTKGESPVLAAAEAVRRASVRDDGQIARLAGGGRSAATIAKAKRTLGLPADASAAELQAASRAYLEHGPDDPAGRQAWEHMWSTLAEKPAFAAGLPAGLPAAGTPAAEFFAARRATAATAAATATAPPAASTGDGVTVDESTGQAVWRGFPIRLTSAGTPAVATTLGWVAVGEARSLSDEELRAPYDIAAMSPSGAVAQMLAEGPR